MNLADRLRKAKFHPKPLWKPRPSLLLCPRVPQPMHGMAPRVVLGRVWWDETRKEAYRATDFHCAACGVWKWNARGRMWLEGHEVYEIDYLLGRMAYVETVALCHYCHNYIHRGRLDAMLERREINAKKYVAIVTYGNDVLFRAKLKRQEPYAGLMAEWEDWRLVINGKEYPPKYKNLAEWEKRYGAPNTKA